MVDETAFRQVLRSTNPQPCSFSKAILANCCACSYAGKQYIAERETVTCADAVARAGCLVLHELLRHNSAFTLKHIHDEDPITHAQEMKVQCGGLHGLQLAVNGADTVADVAALIEEARRGFGSLENLPYSQIVQSVAASKMRRRHDKE